jgi:Ca-activated chloride channel homolog
MKNLPLFALALFLTVFGGFIVNAQPRIVSGTVADAQTGTPLAAVTVLIKGTPQGTVTDSLGHYSLSISGYPTLVFSFVGYQSKEVKTVPKTKQLNVKLSPHPQVLHEVVVADYAKESPRIAQKSTKIAFPAAGMPAPMLLTYPGQGNTEDYSPIKENGFQEVRNAPLTTFSVDVDRAAYSNVRRFLNDGQLPPADAVRIEEMVNYFDYRYPQPRGKHPVAVITELSDSPWNTGLKLLHVGLQAKTIATDHLPASNLVFLIDVSGSMGAPNKLPLVISGFKLLVDQLRPQDRVAVVVYAGAAGLVLPSTAGNEKTKIKDALERLEAGGSTAGGEGIKLAYQEATAHFVKGGNNRVILATDGDFNVGASSDAALQRLVEEKRESGVFLSVLGFGMGNYKDNKMETMADKGNGNYAYIDNLLEAEKVFVKEFGGTLFTVAKDVKIQVEFNPKHVKAYRLIGYENRMLQNEDFNNDKKDAGDMGSGHTVTALYEIVPVGVESSYLSQIDPLKYQETKPTSATASGEMLTLKVRYKAPDGDKSQLLEVPVTDRHVALEKTSDNFRFAAAVASFGLVLRNSPFKGTATYESILSLGKAALDQDSEGYRAEFLKLVKTAKLLDRDQATVKEEGR